MRISDLSSDVCSSDLGRRAASKTPSAGYAETSPEKPTSTTCLPKPSTPSSKTTTTHPENASASLLQPKPSDRCTSNVNPHPDQVRGDGTGNAYPPPNHKLHHTQPSLHTAPPFLSPHRSNAKRRHTRNHSTSTSHHDHHHHHPP